MKKDGEDICYLCEDCEKFMLCEYYHKRKGKSYICKFFKLPTLYGGKDNEERKTGKWIEKNGMYICTACEHRLSKLVVYDVGGIYNYCPNCGAKMEVDA